MRPVVLGFGLVAATGCAQLAGIDNTTGKGADAAELQIARVSIGATVSTAPQDLTSQAAHFLVVADGGGDGGFDRTTADLDASTATWSADIDDDAPLVLFTLPDPDAFPPASLVHLDDLGRDARGELVAFEHPNPTPAGAGLTIAPTLTLPMAWNGTDTFSIDIVGPWATHAVSTAGATSGTSTEITDSIMYSGFTGPTAAPLASVTAADATLALQYAGQKLVGAYAQAGLAGDGTIAAAMAPVTADQTLAVPIDPGAIASQLGGADPPTIVWKLTAAPGAQLGAIDGPRLAAGSVATADTAIDATYGNPFATAQAWPSTLGVQATSSRAVTVGTSMVTLTHALSEISDANAADADFAVTVPTSATVAGVALAADGTNDGAAVTIDPAAPVAVTVETTGAGAATLYRMQLSTLDDGDPVTRTVTFEATARTPSFLLPPELFAAGTTYVLSVTCIAGGFPAAASGDLQMHALPAAEAVFDISTFTVVAP